jgi:hypothetical protein
LAKTDSNQQYMISDEQLANYAPRQYSLRSTVVTTLKMVAISGGVIGLLWAVDMFVSQ